MSLRLIDVDGFRLCIKKMGNGRHTVIFESAMGDALKTWSLIQENISDIATTISYDRAGIGKSENSPNVRCCYFMAQELHRMLEKLKLKPPYIFVAASYGCFIVRTYATFYPQAIEGAIFVEPSHEDFIPQLKKMHTEEENIKFQELWEFTASISKKGYAKEWDNYEKDSEYVRNLEFPDCFPITIISATRCGEAEKLLMQLTQRDVDMRCGLHKKWEKANKNVKQVITRNSGHLVAQDEPDLVIESIRELIRNNNRIS